MQPPGGPPPDSATLWQMLQLQQQQIATLTAIVQTQQEQKVAAPKLEALRAQLEDVNGRIIFFEERIAQSRADLNGVQVELIAIEQKFYNFKTPPHIYHQFPVHKEKAGLLQVIQGRLAQAEKNLAVEQLRKSDLERQLDALTKV